MSVNYVAYTVIGVRIEYDKMYEEKLTRGCKHKEIENSKFCPECGEKTRIIETVLIKGYDHDDQKFGKFDVVYRDIENKDFLFIGKVIKDNSYTEGSQNFCELISFEHLKKELKQLLELLKLWNEDDFGIWTVLYCSY